MSARLYSNENFPLPAVEALRSMGHDVLTSEEAGNAHKAVPDEEVLSYAVSDGRAVVTYNRQDFIRLHRGNADHAGIIVCTENPDFPALAAAIDAALATCPGLAGRLVRVNRNPLT